MSEPWPITWIDEETVSAIAEKAFRNPLKKLEAARNLSSDPTLAISLATFLNIPPEEVESVLASNASVKSLQNAIGSFHQEVLGSVDGWTTTGTSGGVIDILSEKPIAAAGNRTVVAEVKMRYNTIKASDECHIFDKIDEAVRSRGGSKTCVGYLIQIVPKTPEPYDREWKVSGRNTKSHVRAIDGTSAYHLVTGDPNALRDLLHQLPRILRGVLEKRSGAKLDVATTIPAVYIDSAIDGSLPGHSALDD